MNPNGTFTQQEIKMIVQKQKIERMRRDALSWSGFGHNTVYVNLEPLINSITLEKELQAQLKGGPANV